MAATIQWERITLPLTVSYGYLAIKKPEKADMGGHFSVSCDVPHDSKRRFRKLLVPFMYNGKKIDYDVLFSVEKGTGMDKSYPKFKQPGEEMDSSRKQLLEVILSRTSPHFLKQLPTLRPLNYAIRWRGNYIAGEGNARQGIAKVFGDDVHLPTLSYPHFSIFEQPSVINPEQFPTPLPMVYYMHGRLTIKPEAYGKPSREKITLPGRKIIYTPLGGQPR